MNNAIETRKAVSALTREIEAKLEELLFEADCCDIDEEGCNVTVCDLLEEATQNVVSILNCLQTDLTLVELNSH
jgi:hypothetical protein